jgi:hypothetical protein
MQDEVALGLMRILVEMVDPLGVKGRSAAFEAVNFIAFREKEFRQVRSILPGNPGDQRAFWQKPTSFKPTVGTICILDSGPLYQPVVCRACSLMAFL